jgi:hypothetical protein
LRSRVGGLRLRLNPPVCSLTPDNFDNRLIAFDGIDNCRQGAQCQLCRRWIAEPFAVIARSEATKQSSFFRAKLDCFAEPVIGRAFARPVGS